MTEPAYNRAGVTIHCGDCREVLKSLPDESVNCCVTSPPYWGLRDYGTAEWDGGDERLEVVQNENGDCTTHIAGDNDKTLCGRKMGSTWHRHWKDQPLRRVLVDCERCLNRVCDHKDDTKHQIQGATSARKGRSNTEQQRNDNFRNTCGKCGAQRVDQQLGLEKTPEEYVEKLVSVFREVRRVLRDDGTLWLNLSSSYAGSWGNYGGDNRGAGKQRQVVTGSCAPRNEQLDETTKFRPPAASFGGKNPSQSPLLQRVPSCGTDDTAPQDSTDLDSGRLDQRGERPAVTRNRHGHTLNTSQPLPESRPSPSTTTCADGFPASRQECPDVLPPDAHPSTTPQFSSQPSDASGPSATASASQQSPSTSSISSQGSEHTSACTSGTSQKSQPLVVRTQGKESFFSACQKPDCKGVGRCGLCWCSLAIPSLNIKSKDEVNIGHLVAMALQADGWYLRQTIIWHKPNPMPESVTDRCTKAHEYIFLLSKSQRYYYDHEAVQEPTTHQSEAKYDNGKNGHGGGESHEGQGSSTRKFGDDPTTRNKRSVWTVTTKPFKKAHFAVFPSELITPCILAGCPAGGTVLDPFGGSGTTAGVAKSNGRNAVLIELNPEYVPMIVNRLKQGVLNFSE